MPIRITPKLHEMYPVDTEPIIFTTGAYLIPMKVKVGDEVGYVWVMNEFVDDTFICPDAKDCSPCVFSKTREGIFNKLEE